MSALNEIINSGRKLTPGEREEWAKLDRELRQIDATVKIRKDAKRRDKGTKGYAGDARTEGHAGELLAPDQSMTTWTQRAAANGVDGVRRNEGTDRDWNRYWAERMGLASPSIETRALGEDTSSGAGAGQAIVPQVWSTSFIDLLRPNLLVTRAGANVLPMTTEIYNLPQYVADVAPVWLAENSSQSLDANPQFSTLQFNAKGAYMDITTISRQIAEDTNQDGGLSGLIQNTMVQKYARVLDQVAFYGTASNVGNPGLVNEAGLLTSGTTAPAGMGANGSTPTDYTQISIGAEAIRNNNGEPSAVLMNPKTFGTYGRTSASTVAKYWNWHEALDSQMPDGSPIQFLYSSALASNETQGTGTNLSSLYIGDFSRCIIGMRVALDVTVLTERYADLGQIGLWSYLRMSIRFAHPETFYRLTGIVTT
jgi:HK97 family phage major capsid protein